MLTDLPRDVTGRIMALLPSRDILVVMMVCSEMRAVGKHCRRWRDRCESEGIPAPKPRATRYKTYHDVFMRHACRMCFHRRQTMHGYCCRCFQLHPELSYALTNYRDLVQARRRLRRRLDALHSQFWRAHHQTTVCRQCLEGLGRITQL